MNALPKLRAPRPKQPWPWAPGVLLIAALAVGFAGHGHWSEASALPAPPAQPPKKDPDDPSNLPTGSYALFRSKGEVQQVEHPKLEAALKAYEAARRALRNGHMTQEGMKKVYAAGDFETVKTLIEQKKVALEHSIDMADLRILMCLQVFEAICKEKNWGIYRSDSGNQSAGMASDVDQTIFVYEARDGSWVRNEALDAEAARLFVERFQSMHGLSVKTLDIATIAGKDKYPDWRLASRQVDHEGQRPVRLHAGETMAALRKTPGAYTYCGAVVQQMQLRVADQIEEQLRLGRQTPPIQDKRPMLPELQEKLGKDGRLAWLTCLKIGPGDGADTKIAPREVFQEEAVQVMFDGLKPQLLRGHAYDAGVANYLEFMHHLDDGIPAVKYHLRGLDDGVSTLRRLDAGKPRTEYASLKTDAARRDHLKQILGADLARPRPDGTSFLDRWKVAFDISAEVRRLHNAKALSTESYRRALRPLAEELAGKNKTFWVNYIDRAEAEYLRRCQEFFLHNIIETSTQRVLEWLAEDPNAPDQRVPFESLVDEARMREALKLDGPQHDADWKGVREELMRNFGELARLQVLYSFHELHTRPDLVKEIVALAERRGVRGADLAKLKAVVEETRAGFLRDLKFGFKEMARFPRLYLLVYKAQAKQKAPEYAKRVRDWVLTEVGIVDTDAHRQPSKWLKEVGLEGVETRVNDFFRKSKLAGTTDRFLRNMFFNLGTVQSASTVLREYSESGGDPDVLRDTTLRELLNMVPVVGQVKGFIEADGAAQRFLAVAPLAVPAAGAVIAVYVIAENGLVLYQHEYAQPLTGEAADVIYRGYVGPSLYEFNKESHPPAFTEADKEALTQAEAEVEKLKGKTGKAELAQLVKSLMQVRLLKDKRSAWNTWQTEDNRYRGSAIAGTASQPKQKVLDIGKPADPLFEGTAMGTPGSLLARVTPIIFYSRNPADGPVDFTIKPLTADQLKHRDELDRRLGTALDPDVYCDVLDEWAVLDEQQKAYERARRYLASAKDNHELMLQIRRDSLWPYMLSDRDNDLVSPERFVGQWVAIRRAPLEAALKQVGIKDDPKPWSREVLKEISDRLQEDIQRSKEYWSVYQETVKGRAQQAKLESQQRKSALAAAVILDAVRKPTPRISAAARKVLVGRGLSDDDFTQLGAIANAYTMRHVPDAPPTITVGVRRVPADQPNEYDYCPDVKVTANPAIYQAPYHVKLVQLDPTEVKNTIAARRYQGLPLDAAAVAALSNHLARYPAPKDLEKDKFTPALLVFAFCEAVHIPQRVAGETVAALPHLSRLPIPGEGKSAYYFGGIVVPASGLPPFETPLPRLDARVDTAHVEGSWLVEIYSATPAEIKQHPEKKANPSSSTWTLRLLQDGKYEGQEMGLDNASTTLTKDKLPGTYDRRTRTLSWTARSPKGYQALYSFQMETDQAGAVKTDVQVKHQGYLRFSDKPGDSPVPIGKDLYCVLTRVPGPSVPVTGAWSCSDGGSYQLEQQGNTLSWEGRSPDNGKQWVNRFQGTIVGTFVVGSWRDVEPGLNRFKGTMTLELVIANGRVVEIRKKQAGGDGFGGNSWKPK